MERTSPSWQQMPVTRSIAFRLPLFVVVLFSAIISGLAWSSYRQLTHQLERYAENRLERAGARLADLLQVSVTRVRHEAAVAAANPATIRALTAPGPENFRLARLALQPAKTSGNEGVSRVLYSRHCSLVPIAGLPPARALDMDCPGAPDHAAGLARQPGQPAWLQSFAASGDTIGYEVVAPVVFSGDTVGFVVDRRTLQPNESAHVIEGLIGRDVSFLLGNASGSALWTDLSRRVSGPALFALGDARDQSISYADSAGVRQFGVAHAVPLTPWIIWLQLPRDQVVEPAVQSLRQWGIFALIGLLTAVAGAWAVCRHVTRPLIDVTEAAEALARGNYGRRVTAANDRHDELGVLVHSFNHMASEVDQSTVQLQEQAVELEIQAEQAQEQAVELEVQAEQTQELMHELERSNTELKRALAEAMQARRDTTEVQSLLDEVLVQAPIGISVFDRDMRYVRLNQVVADIHGVPLEAHYGKRPGELVPLLGELAEPLLAQVLETGREVLDQRLSASILDGEQRHWIASCFPLRGPQGVVTGVGAILVDTTKQKELEDQFLQAQKMEAVGRLAGGVAHDFNNLLTVITSYSSMALGTLRPNDPLYEDIGEIRSAADRAARLTSQLLAFSRKQVMRPQVLDLSSMARDMERMLQRLIGEDVTLELALDPNAGLVSADPGQMEQVIMNLVVNARDAMPNGGHLVIETANMAFTSELSMTELGSPAGEYVVLSVTDTGTGMSAETQANLFEPFFTTKAAGRGTGLGLSTVYGIVKQSGGDIHVRSEPGRGTTFRIYFPRVQGEERRAVALPSEGLSSSGSEVILLVEDDVSLRRLAGRVLRDAGYTVLDSHSATEAVLTGSQHEGLIDLLLTDVVMPEMSGRTVAELLTKQRPELGVLYMSGYTDDDVVRRGILTTETEFLQKPFTPEQLLQQVRTILDARLASRAA